MAHIDATVMNFEQEVIEASKSVLVLVDFWAPWCGPCRILGPMIEEIAESHAGKVKVVKVNVDEEEMLAMQYRISSIPAMKFFKNGVEVLEMIGIKDTTRNDIIQFIEKA